MRENWIKKKKKKLYLAGERLDRWFDVIVNEIEAILRSTWIGDAKRESGESGLCRGSVDRKMSQVKKV